MTDVFQEIVESRHEYARSWKARTGGKVVGYFCTYVPEEVMYAAGVLPVRILGSHNPQDVTEPHIYGMYCPFCRDCLAQALQGRYDYLDGLVMARSCIHMYQAFDSWQRHLPISFSHFLATPARPSLKGARPYWTDEVGEFKAALENWLGKEITAQALDGAIEVYNLDRDLMRQVYELRKGVAPPISGAEVMDMALAMLVMDKAEHCRLLQRTLKQASERKGEPGVRVMVLGSEVDDRELLGLIESLGCIIVTDDHCTGTRYFWSDVLPQDGGLAAIARRYLEKPPCPHRELVERVRFEHILGLARDYQVQGAFLIIQKFCEVHGFDVPAIQKLLQGQSIPSLVLEVDVTNPAGSFRTRIEAFVELLQAEI